MHWEISEVSFASVRKRKLTQPGCFNKFLDKYYSRFLKQLTIIEQAGGQISKTRAKEHYMYWTATSGMHVKYIVKYLKTRFYQ